MIKYFAMDVDGTLTDGKIYMGAESEMFKAFNIKDGYGIHNILPEEGIIPVVITGRESAIVVNRCRELEISAVFQNVKDKAEVLAVFTNDELNAVAYIGDDLNDLSVMERVHKAGGIVGCPADAMDKVKSCADYVSKHNGGEGAVRDFIDWIIEKEYVC